MAVRGARLFSALAVGGVLTGSLLLGSGSALAQTSPYGPSPYAPAPTGNTVPAQCGDTVAAAPGDRVLVTPTIGAPFSQLATAGMDPVAKTLGGVLCQVDVSVVEPMAPALVQLAPEPLRSTVGSVSRGASAALHPAPQATQAPMMAPAPMMAAAPPYAAAAPAAFPALTPQQQAASAPMFAPAFGSLPDSFLRDMMTPGMSASGLGLPAAAPAGKMMDPSMLFGSAFPGLRAGAPAYLGYDPASAVTTASQVQALPVDGLPSSNGIGLPVLIAVLVLAGVAAFAVRRSVLGSRTVAEAAGAAESVPSAAPAVAALSTGSAGTRRKKIAAPEVPEATEVVAPEAADADVPDVEKTMVVPDVEQTMVVPDVERTLVTDVVKDVEKTIVTGGALVGTAGA